MLSMFAIKQGQAKSADQRRIRIRSDFPNRHGPFGQMNQQRVRGGGRIAPVVPHAGAQVNRGAHRESYGRTGCLR